MWGACHVLLLSAGFRLTDESYLHCIKKKKKVIHVAFFTNIVKSNTRLSDGTRDVVRALRYCRALFLFCLRSLLSVEVMMYVEDSRPDT